MSLPKIFTYIAVLTISFTVFVSESVAGLFGFHNYNPYTRQERILNLKDVPFNILNYRAEMRNNLLMLIRYAKQKNPDFKIIAHEGQDLLTKSLWEYDREGYNRARQQENAEDNSFLFHTNYREQEPKRYSSAYDYLNLIDAIALNNLYCGSGSLNKVTENHHLDRITIEQCADENALITAQISAEMDGRITYAFTDLITAFNGIGDYNLLNDSAKNVYNIADAQNILILDDDSLYETKEQLAKDILKTNYDIVIIKPLFANRERFSAEDLQKMHFKKNGSKRLLIAELNVSEADPQDYFWQKDWRIGMPQWLVRQSFTSPSSVITQFWQPEWKRIISRYFRDIVNEGFDGVFFTGIQNYRYFEQQNPLE